MCLSMVKDHLTAHQGHRGKLFLLVGLKQLVSLSLPGQRTITVATPVLPTRTPTNGQPCWPQIFLHVSREGTPP